MITKIKKTADTFSNGADSIQQTLFNIDYLFENIVGDVGNQLRQSSQSNPAHLSAFLQFMRSLQLKGHILWGVALDIITDDEELSLKPLEDFAVKSARQQGKVSFKDNVMKIFGGGVTVGIKTMLYQVRNNHFCGNNSSVIFTMLGQIRRSDQYAKSL